MNLRTLFRDQRPESGRTVCPALFSQVLSAVENNSRHFSVEIVVPQQLDDVVQDKVGDGGHGLGSPKNPHDFDRVVSFL